MRRLTSRVVTETLREARDVGLVAHGCVTTVGRTALAGEPGDDTALVAAMHRHCRSRSTTSSPRPI